MKKQIVYALAILMLSTPLTAQVAEEGEKSSVRSRLFTDEEILPIRLKYSTREMKEETNDSTYIQTELAYEEDDGSWRVLDVKFRARGHNRRETCYYTPIKIKIKKSVSKDTEFEGNKKLKLVLPCLMQKDRNDNVVKEFLAYKIYEQVTPYHFKTRLLDIDYTEIRGKKEKKHKIKGFVIEDIDKVADRNGGQELKDRKVHPLQQHDHSSVQNDMFQYMIGNTDYSNAYQHNCKLIFVEGKGTIPVPYDFDLCGLVNASYAVVSQIQNETLPITEVTQRLFRGFERDEAVYAKVRKDYLLKRVVILEEMDRWKPAFEDPREFDHARNYIDQFFRIMANDKNFEREILNKMRTK